MDEDKRDHCTAKEKVRTMLKMKVTTKVSLMVFLIVFSAVDARFDPTSFITQVLPKSGENYVKSTSTACCDLCVCTRSIPPQCRCWDVVDNYCHSACNKCVCTKSEPPMCECMDVNNFCYPSCSSNQ
ncbi:Proteinase inhibitor I12 [Vigna unguiculata]|uniref:Proteinase inhibitor I12 n=1 Tax=Vigna unguiculata TaxID=3917 RepID=A0A4D6NK83_VIGUN|nr:Proteinase inhibitor I12 [Vigna unguiculata]